MQSDSALARELRHYYLFSVLSDAQRERLLACAETHRFASGEHLFSHRDVAAHFVCGPPQVTALQQELDPLRLCPDIDQRCQ